LLSKIYLPYI